jgi:hypothetical protein
MAVIATTFALVARFTAFMAGARRFQTVRLDRRAGAILASLMVALVVSPRMMAAYLLKPSPHVGQEEKKIALMQLPACRDLVSPEPPLADRGQRRSFLRRLDTGTAAAPQVCPAADRAQTQINLELSVRQHLWQTPACWPNAPGWPPCRYCRCKACFHRSVGPATRCARARLRL